MAKAPIHKPRIGSNSTGGNMKNKKKMQEQMEMIVRIKSQLKSKTLDLKAAYFEYYRAMGLTTEQAEKLI